MDGIKERREEWQSGMAKNITFIVTKDCQLACKYCYLIGKNTKERMSWEIAKAAIDYILDHEEDMKEESVIWDFIGGEPFLEIDLVDKICDYLKVERCIAEIIIGSTLFVFLSQRMALIIVQKRYKNSLRRIILI